MTEYKILEELCTKVTEECGNLDETLHFMGLEAAERHEPILGVMITRALDNFNNVKNWVRVIGVKVDNMKRGDDSEFTMSELQEE